MLGIIIIRVLLSAYLLFFIRVATKLHIDDKDDFPPISGC